jgi:hypothetical protein
MLEVQKELNQATPPALETDRKQRPVVGLELRTSDAKSFHWKEYYIPALLALEESLVDYKVDYGVKGISRNSEGELTIQRRIAVTELRKALENALRHRRPDMFFIDDAQHLAKNRGSTLQDRLDNIKSLASTTNTLHGTIGTYDMPILSNSSGQPSGDSIDIHFKRYDYNCAKDVRDFMGVVENFLYHMPLEETPNLLEYGEYIYCRTLGCVGLLKAWFTRALHLALTEGVRTLTLKHLEDNAMAKDKLIIMLKEIKKGEELFAV